MSTKFLGVRFYLDQIALWRVYGYAAVATGLLALVAAWQAAHIFEYGAGNSDGWAVFLAVAGGFFMIYCFAMCEKYYGKWYFRQREKTRFPALNPLELWVARGILLIGLAVGFGELVWGADRMGIVYVEPLHMNDRPVLCISACHTVAVKVGLSATVPSILIPNGFGPVFYFAPYPWAKPKPWGIDRIQIVWRGVLVEVEEGVPGSGRFVSPYIFPLNPGEELIVIARGKRSGVEVSLPYSIRRAK